MRFAVTTLFSCMLVAFTASADEAPDKFSGFIGGEIGVKPDYLGSDHSKLTFIPAVKVDYGPFFVGGVDTLTALGWAGNFTTRNTGNSRWVPVPISLRVRSQTMTDCAEWGILTYRLMLFWQEVIKMLFPAAG